jgi:hypothetical protein
MVTIELDGNELRPVPVDTRTFPLPAHPGVLMDGAAGLSFVDVRPFWPDTVAMSMAARGQARALALCPPLVSPAGSMLALDVARLLVDERGLWDGPGYVITCAVRPRCGRDSPSVIVPHPVIISGGGTTRSRVIWELTDRRRVPALVAGWRQAPLTVAV